MTGHVATARTEIQAPPERVWEAMTDPAQVAEYMMGSQVESDYQPGSPITWSGQWEGKAYQDKGEVLQAEPGRLLEVTHYSPLTGAEDVPENYHTVRYELSSSDGRHHRHVDPGRVHRCHPGRAVLAELAGDARRPEEGRRVCLTPRRLVPERPDSRSLWHRPAEAVGPGP